MRYSYTYYLSILSLCLFLFVCIYPLSELVNINDYNRQRFAQVILLITTARFIFLADFLSIKYKNALSLIFALGLISSVLSESPLAAFLNYIHFIFLGGLIGLGYQSKKHIEIIFYLLFFSNIVLVSLILMDISFFIISEDKLNFKSVHYGFSNVRFFNQFQIITLFSLIYAASKPNIRFLALTFIFLNFFIMMQTGARGATLSFLLILFSSFYLNIDKVAKETLITIYKVISISFVLFFLFNLNFNDEQLGYTFRQSSSGRLDIWLELLNRLTIKNIVLGNGPGTFVSDLYKLSHPHNSLLQILYNWGGIITIILSVMVTHVIKHLLIGKTFFSFEKLIAYSIFTTLIVYSFFSGIIVMPLPQTFLFFFWGVLLAYTFNFKKETSVLSRKKTIILGIIICIYLLLVLFSKSCIYSPQYGPSYWNHGVISLQSCSLSD